MSSAVLDSAPSLGQPIGPLIREWRNRRRRSQLELSNESGISTRHLSFVETGRSRPSRDLVLRIADQLEVPLRERNTPLLAAGYAPAYDARTLEAAAMFAIREASDQILPGTHPPPDHTT